MSLDPKERTSRLWSTEAASALGLPNARYTPAQVWAAKRGLTDLPEVSEEFPVRAGLAFQDTIARMHAEDTQSKLAPLGELALVADAALPMGMHGDYFNRTTMMLHEVKFFAAHRQREFGAPGSDVVPDDVIAQALHEMAVWNLQGKPPYGKANGVEVNVMFGNQARIVFVVPWDQGAIDTLLAREAEFWKLVEGAEPPPVTTPADARRVWTKTDGSERAATPEILRACQTLAAIKAHMKSLEAQGEAVEAYIQDFMRIAETLRGPRGEVLATWNLAKGAERVDVKKLRAAHPEIAKACTVIGEPSRRFLLKG